MKGVNKVIIVGSLGQDPEMRQMPNGDAVTNISVATSESWTDKATGNKQERTEWHKIIFFKRLAEIAGEYLKKGSQVYIEGSLRTRKYQKDGSDRYTTEIIADEMQMLGGKQEGKESQPAKQPAQQNMGQGGGMADDDFSDIPFIQHEKHLY